MRWGVERALTSDDDFEPREAGGDLSESVRRRTSANWRTAGSAEVVPSWARAARTPAGDWSMAWLRACSALVWYVGSAWASLPERSWGGGGQGRRASPKANAGDSLGSVGVVGRREAGQDGLEGRQV